MSGPIKDPAALPGRCVPGFVPGFVRRFCTARRRVWLWSVLPNTVAAKSSADCHPFIERRLGSRQLWWGKRCLALGLIPWLFVSWSLGFSFRARFKGTLMLGARSPALLRAALLTSLRAPCTKRVSKCLEVCGTVRRSRLCVYVLCSGCVSMNVLLI